jgi:hypothetical protein
LAGARDTAINTNAPAGIRLLPDPALIGINPSTGALDPTRILASNRYIPIQLAPDYAEGLVTIDTNLASLVTAFNNAGIANPAQYFVYPVAKSPSGLTTYYPAGTGALLYVEQSAFTVDPQGHLLGNTPTSWYWNIRIGDKIQFNGTGIWYTIVGPMNVPNPELFVNVGNPGATPPLQRPLPNGANGTYNPDFLFLVNGVDDNLDGYVDNGWDGVDNDGDGVVDQVINTANGITYIEWTETEAWQDQLRHGANVNIPYIIARRPVVSPGSRETLLPSNVVVDLTSWEPPSGYAPERSRLPVDPSSGYVDILLYPNGTVVPTTEYSSPSSFGMGSTFYHFWLAERGDLFDPLAQAGVPYLLPMVAGTPNYPSPGDTRVLKGERRLMTLYARTGQLITNQVETFDGLNPSLPFLLPQQGIRGDTR